MADGETETLKGSVIHVRLLRGEGQTQVKTQPRRLHSPALGSQGAASGSCDLGLSSLPRPQQNPEPKLALRGQESKEVWDWWAEQARFCAKHIPPFHLVPHGSLCLHEQQFHPTLHICESICAAETGGTFGLSRVTLTFSPVLRRKPFTGLGLESILCGD